MYIKQLLIISFLISTLVSCTNKEDLSEVKPADSAAQPHEKPPAGVIPKHQLDALKKAQDVEGLLQKADDKMRKQLDSM